MKRVVCTVVDDCTLEVVRDDTTIVLGFQSPRTVIINPSITIEGCPLVTYVGMRGYDNFRNVVYDVCMQEICESYFSNDVKLHLKNGLAPRGKMESDAVIETAMYVYKTWLDYRERQNVKQEEKNDSSFADSLF